MAARRNLSYLSFNPHHLPHAPAMNCYSASLNTMESYGFYIGPDDVIELTTTGAVERGCRDFSYNMKEPMALAHWVSRVAVVPPTLFTRKWALKL